MITSHKLFIMVIFINLLMGTVTQAYYEPESFAFEQIDNQITHLEASEEDFVAEEGVFTKAKQVIKDVQDTIYNGIAWSVFLSKILLKGLFAMPIKAFDSHDIISQMVAYALILFRSLFYVLLIVEGFMIFKNRKQS